MTNWYWQEGQGYSRSVLAEQRSRREAEPETEAERNVRTYLGWGDDDEVERDTAVESYECKCQDCPDCGCHEEPGEAEAVDKYEHDPTSKFFRKPWGQ